MALNDESRALLQLLLVRGKNYGEIGKLLGVEPEEVHHRASGAIEPLGDGEGPLEPVVVDYMLGQADPIGRAEAVRKLSDDSAQADLFSRTREQLILVFPEANIPTPPVGTGKKAQPVSGGAKPGPSSRAEDEPSVARAEGEAEMTEKDSGRGGRGLSGIDGRSRTVLAALVAAVGLAAIVAVVVLLSGGGAEQEISEGPPGRTVSVLRPPEGEQGRGKVEFGFAGARFAANIAFSELAPNRNDEGYALWLQGPAGSFPFDSAKVGEEGTITGRSEISQAIICFIAADLFTEVRVSRVSDAELTKALRRAVNRNVRQADFPDYVGTTVLSGPISMPLESRQQIIEACGGTEAAASGGNQGS